MWLEKWCLNDQSLPFEKPSTEPQVWCEPRRYLNICQMYCVSIRLLSDLMCVYVTFLFFFKLLTCVWCIFLFLVSEVNITSKKGRTWRDFSPGLINTGIFSYHSFYYVLFIYFCVRWFIFSLSLSVFHLLCSCSPSLLLLCATTSSMHCVNVVCSVCYMCLCLFGWQCKCFCFLSGCWNLMFSIMLLILFWVFNKVCVLCFLSIVCSCLFVWKCSKLKQVFCFSFQNMLLIILMRFLFGFICFRFLNLIISFSNLFIRCWWF